MPAGHRLGGNRIYWRDADLRRVAAHFGDDFARIAGLVDLDDAPAFLAPPMPATISRAADGPQKRRTFTIATPHTDRFGDQITTAGWDLRHYRKNPVVQWAHASALLPIGRAVRTWIENGVLRSTVVLATQHSASAAQVESMIDAGFLSAASVGFRPLKFRFTADPKRPLGIDFQEAELLEWSICSVPANPFCLADPMEPAKSTDAAAQRRQRDLDLVRMRA